ncbi:MAG: aldehyde dehydrogenase family protein [Bryobacterales bacterium]
MIHLPVLRWGDPYTSLDKDKVVHFDTGEPIAEVSQANAGIIRRDMRKAQRARDVLREIPCVELVKMVQKASELYMKDELPLGDGETQTPDDFVRQQSATTGLPEHMARKNMEKIAYVLSQMDRILDSLTRGLDLSILTAGYGKDPEGRLLSYQAQTNVLGMVLPSNSPGVHTLWMPVIPMQIGLVLKPGPQEPWTPYRMAQAMFQCGVPKEAIALYPGGMEAGVAVLETCNRAMLFGSQATVDQHFGNPKVQVHGPGYTKILIGDDLVDNWKDYLDLMETSVLLNSGRSCINCSAIYVSRHGKEIAKALGERLAKVKPLPPEDPKAPLAAFTVAGVAEAISAAIDDDLKGAGAEDMTAKFREGSRAITKDHCSYLLPTVVYCESPEVPIAKKEFMFPFVNIVECPQEKMLDSIGPTLVCSGITEDPKLRQALLDSADIDRLNLGPVPTTQLDWLQPHEGNIVEFLYRARAFQSKSAA